VRLSRALVLVLLWGMSRPAAAQGPEQSAARARQLLDTMIAALGGPAYLHVRDQTCRARAAFFGHSGELTNYDVIYDLILWPDKERIEYSSKRNIIDVFNDGHGWTLDRAGVSEQPQTAVEDFQRGLRRDLDYLLRFRLSEPGLELRYGGPDLVDLQEADWVVIDDADHRTIRIAISRATHLPLRAVFIERDPATHERTEEVEYFSNYQSVQRIETPFQRTRLRNGQKLYQLFIQSCQYNTGLSPSLFTREALEQRWAELSKRRH